MRLIENINSLIRFCSYLLPLFILVFGREIIWKVMNKLSWYRDDLKVIVYMAMLILASLFAIVAIYKLFRYTNKKKYKTCIDFLTTESKIRIANLAEGDSNVELYFEQNQEWLEKDIEHLIEKYSKEVAIADYERFKHYVNTSAVIHFSHRVTNRKQFLDILNRL